MSLKFSGSKSFIHVKQDIFHTFIHWSKYSTNLLYIKFTPAQNLSHSLTHATLHFSASSSFNFHGYEIQSDMFFSTFISVFKFFRTFTVKFRNTFQRSTTEIVCFFYFLTQSISIYYIYIYKIYF
jgi:hypothetical protein